MPIYKKLNYLASHLAPYYSDVGYMSGNLVQLTVGNYLWEQPGFIDSISIDIDDETPWEVNVGLDGDIENGDINIKQVPHMIKVSISFTPIHRFRPQIQTLTNNDANSLGVDADGVPIVGFDKDSTGFGPQRYISLQDNDNFNSGYNPQSPLPPPPTTPTTTNENRIFIGDTALGGQYGVSYLDEIPSQDLSRTPGSSVNREGGTTFGPQIPNHIPSLPNYFF